jgi:hypothetical protein
MVRVRYFGKLSVGLAAVLGGEIDYFGADTILLVWRSLAQGTGIAALENAKYTVYERELSSGRAK